MSDVGLLWLIAVVVSLIVGGAWAFVWAVFWTRRHDGSWDVVPVADLIADHGGSALTNRAECRRVAAERARMPINGSRR